MCLVEGGVGVVQGVWVRGLGLGFTNLVGTRGVRYVCLCLECGCMRGVGGIGWVDWARVG